MLCRHCPRRHRHPAVNTRAFTLVEILIVVIILGIIATIVIAIFHNTVDDARAKALKDDLRNIRSQLQLYSAEHGTYPTLSSFEQQMVLFSDEAGNTSNTKSPIFRCGPYIVEMPRLPVGVNHGMTTVTASGSYAAGYGWAYDPVTGDFRANLPDSDVDGDGVRFNTY
jgi:prepilin-type N-terminal cleavage/methylation domain-containing protein